MKDRITSFFRLLNAECDIVETENRRRRSLSELACQFNLDEAALKRNKSADMMNGNLSEMQVRTSGGTTRLQMRCSME